MAEIKPSFLRVSHTVPFWTLWPTFIPGGCELLSVFWQKDIIVRDRFPSGSALGVNAMALSLFFIAYILKSVLLWASVSW